jgi:DNA-binding response OmpR family regulator
VGKTPHGGGVVLQFMLTNMAKENPSPAGSPDEAPTQRQLKPTHRILVVEDNADIRRLNAEVLARSGYHVDAAEDGAAAWDTLQRNRYDLLITDNDMPKVSGVELLQKVRAAHMALPVIMATGVPPEDGFIHSPWLQPAALLLKPYSFHELLGTVRSVLLANGPESEATGPPDWPSGTSAGTLRC